MSAATPAERWEDMTKAERLEAVGEYWEVDQLERFVAWAAPSSIIGTVLADGLVDEYLRSHYRRVWIEAERMRGETADADAAYDAKEDSK